MPERPIFFTRNARVGPLRPPGLRAAPCRLFPSRPDSKVPGIPEADPSKILNWLTNPFWGPGARTFPTCFFL